MSWAYKTGWDRWTQYSDWKLKYQFVAVANNEDMLSGYVEHS